MCEQQYQAEVLDEEEMLDAEGQRIDDSLFSMMVAMNRARLEMMNDDLPSHKRGDYTEKMYEQADMLRKARRENGN